LKPIVRANSSRDKRPVLEEICTQLQELLTYLKLTGLTLGLIINWNVVLLLDGIRRFVRNHPGEAGGREAEA
jgi:hypothetical protein